MVFSTNQAKQLYVATTLYTSSGDPSTLKNIKFFSDGDGGFYAKYVGNDGLVRTDIIKANQIAYAKGVKAATMSEYLDSAFVTIVAPASGGTPTVVPGQQYILRVNLDRFGGDSDENKGLIMADYTAKSSDAVKDVLAGLAISLAKNAAKAAYEPLIKVYVSTNDETTDTITLNTNTWVVAGNESQSTVVAHGTLASLMIEAVEPASVLGKGSIELPKFSVSTNIIIASSVETVWADVKKNAVHPTAAILNNKKIAELEWFCAGERGDIYRGVGYPNNFEFKPLAAAATYGYDIIDISYYYGGNCEDSQKSIKELVIAVPAPSSYSSSAESYKILAAINSAAGSTVITQVFGS